MMWCNNPACDFSFDESKEKTPMSCPKCGRSSFGRPKGYDPFRYVHYGTVSFPGGRLSVYGTYLVLW
jgi:hypothetical protein